MSVEISERLLERLVETVLRSLHIPGTLKGLPYLTHAIAATVQNPHRTALITKDLYHEIARVYNTTPSGVDRAMRWAIRMSWETSRNELCQMAGYHLTQRPTNREFIDLVAFYIRSR